MMRRVMGLGLWVVACALQVCAQTSHNATAIWGRSISSATPTTNYVMCFNGTSWTFCAASSGTVTSVGLAGTANQVTVTGSSPITSSGSWTLTLPAAVILGTDNSTAGTLQLANGSANAHTIWGSGATTTNTILGFATAPTTGHLVTATVSGTTTTLTDGGAVPAGTVTSIATSSPITGGTITSSGTICVCDLRHQRSISYQHRDYERRRLTSLSDAEYQCYAFKRWCHQSAIVLHHAAKHRSIHD